MFKKGQLVRSKKSGCLYSIFSADNRGSSSICKLRNVFTGGRATVSAEYLTLIGNNFKFKGRSDGRINLRRICRRGHNRDLE